MTPSCWASVTAFALSYRQSGRCYRIIGGAASAGRTCRRHRLSGEIAGRLGQAYCFQRNLVFCRGSGVARSGGAAPLVTQKKEEEHLPGMPSAPCCASRGVA